MSHRSDKIAGLLVQYAAMFIAREAGRSTLITPTRGNISKDGKNATIFVSVFPTEEKEHAIAFLERNRANFKDFLKKVSRLSMLPRVNFEFDAGEENRQHLDELSKQM